MIWKVQVYQYTVDNTMVCIPEGIIYLNSSVYDKPKMY